jgi:hypothetical protein
MRYLPFLEDPAQPATPAALLAKISERSREVTPPELSSHPPLGQLGTSRALLLR